MKVYHVEARIKTKFKLPESFLKKLPKKVAVFTTIQLISSLDSIVEQIKNSGRKPFVFKTGHTRHKGQILGCNVQEFSDYADEDFDSFVYIGDGMFHPTALIMKNKDKKVFVYNPFNDKEYIVDQKDIEKKEKLQRAALSRFYMAENVGVLVSTKPGQFFLRKALELKQEYPDKKFFFIMDNTINFFGLEDFPFVDCWINTACPRIGYDDTIKISKAIVNFEDVKKKDARRARIV